MGSHRDKGSSTNWRFVMKVVVIGGTGLIGSKVVAKLTQHDDHTLVPGRDATVFPTRFEDWLIDNAPAPAR
jgi:hypothetical protein